MLAPLPPASHHTGEDGSQKGSNRAFWSLVVVAATAVAFALRLYRLDGQSLWYDEGFSVALARQSLADLFHTTVTVENHPPLHPLLLHGIIRLIGDSEFAVRFLSVWTGTLVIPVLARLIWRLAGAQAGFLAAVLAAGSPFYVYYAQEARMYAPLLLCTVLALDALAAALATNRAGAWLRFTLYSLLALYTHYLAALFLVAVPVVVGLCIVWPWRSPGKGRMFWHAALSCAGIILGYAPWAAVALQQYRAEPNYYEGALASTTVLMSVLAFFSGALAQAPTLPMPAYGWLLLALAATGAVASLFWRAGDALGRGTTLWFLVAGFLIPTAAFLALMALHPKFHPRYLIMVSPAYYGLAAVGLAWLLSLARRWRPFTVIPWTFGVAVAGAWWASLGQYYHDPALARDDWRGAAAFLQAARNPGEPVLLVAGYAQPIFAYYYQGSGIYRVPDRPILRMSETVDQAELERLDQAIGTPPRVWVVGWQEDVVDPAGLLAQALAQNAEMEQDLPQFQGVRVQAFRLHGQSLARSMPSIPFAVNFADRVELLGYDLPQKTVGSGEAVPVRLYWRAQDAIEANFKAAVRVLDAQGFAWGSADQRPAGETNYTRRWRPGARFSADFLVPVQPGTPPGDYQLELVLYDEANLEPVPANIQGKAVQPMAVIANVRIAPRAAPGTALVGLQPLPVPPVAGLIPVGYALEQTECDAGDPLELTLGWQAPSPPAVVPDLAVSLVNPQGQTVVTERKPLFQGQVNAADWRGGEQFLTRHRLLTPPDATGTYTVQVALYRPDGQGTLLPPQSVGVAHVKGRSPRYDPPPVVTGMQARFGSAIALTGFNLERTELQPGQRLRLTLVWHALEYMQERYKVFVHFVNAQGGTVAQRDSEPVSGALATVRWLPGEYVVDEHVFPLPDDLAAGDYRLIIGLYRAPAGARLPVGTGDSLELPQSVHIAPRAMLKR